MSDTPQGPGWWLASDGRWYAPEHAPARPGEPASSPTFGIDHTAGADRTGPAEGGARPGPPSAVRADPARSPGATGTDTREPPPAEPDAAPVEAWEFTDPVESDIPTRRNVWPVVGAAFGVSAVLVVLVAIALALLGGAGDDVEREAADASDDRTGITSVVIGEDDGASACEAGSDDPDDTRNLCLYPDRPDRRRSDHEAALGQPVLIDGVEATATTVRAATNPSGEAVMVVDVELRNVGAANHDYNLFDWHLMTTDGEVLDPFGVPPADAEELASDSLPRGDAVTGTVTFASGTMPSYIVYQPSLVDDGRGIWLAEE